MPPGRTFVHLVCFAAMDDSTFITLFHDLSPFLKVGLFLLIWKGKMLFLSAENDYKGAISKMQGKNALKGKKIEIYFS